MNIKVWTTTLNLTHEWTIASGLKTGGKSAYEVFLVELTDKDGNTGLGESSPPTRYCESQETVRAFLQKVNASKLSFDDIPGSMAYLETLSSKDYSAKCAINIALVDGVAKKAGKAVYDYFGIGFTENKHVTSFSIGIDSPEMIYKKTLEADIYPSLKLKVGSPDDRQNMKALRDAAPTKTVRVDGNEGWKTKEEALANIEWFAQDKHVEYVEQPMPSGTPVQDLVWLKERSPLPLFADESFHNSKDVAHCLECFHGVNMKLCKTGGLTEGFAALQAARKVGLKTMIGCMIETSVLITAAAHLAELADYLDIDGNILINNDPYSGATAERGVVSFANAPTATGLRVTLR
ncbi:MAG: dipeptide epimerase [Verrucomicrobia bacterium]|nr:dipeptide epimerase [Verrucomicrobiota bacterium]